MNLFKKKCEYCRKKIDKDKEVFRDVKDPIFVGTRKKAFCCEGHANNYEKEVNTLEKCKSRCCG